MTRGLQPIRASALSTATMASRSLYRSSQYRKISFRINSSGISIIVRTRASGEARFVAPASGAGSGAFPLQPSVHATGSDLRSATLTIPWATACSPSFRHAVQNETRCAAEQNLGSLPLWPERRALSHQRHARGGSSAVVASRFVVTFGLVTWFLLSDGFPRIVRQRLV